MKRMGGVVLVVLIATMTIPSMSFADVVQIPGSIRVGEFRKFMKNAGMDLSGKDESDGMIENQGTRIKVVTYQAVTMEQLDLMKEAATKSTRQNG